jgi:hypothetical protein
MASIWGKEIPSGPQPGEPGWAPYERGSSFEDWERGQRMNWGGYQGPRTSLLDMGGRAGVLAGMPSYEDFIGQNPAYQSHLQDQINSMLGVQRQLAPGKAGIDVVREGAAAMPWQQNIPVDFLKQYGTPKPKDPGTIVDSFKDMAEALSPALLGLGYGAVTGAFGTGAGAAGAGAGATAAETLLGPATGTTLGAGTAASGATATGVGAAGAPIVSGMAAGGGPFIPTLGGMGAGAAATASELASNKGLQAALRGLPGLLGAIGSKRQSDKQDKLARDYLALGAPSRQRYEESFKPGFSMGQDPGFQDALNQAAKSNLHALSIQGNPAGSPNAWNQSLTDLYQRFSYPALQNYRNMNSNAGGISSLQTSVPQIAMNSINSERGIYDAMGAGAADIFNPPQKITLKDLMNMKVA